MKRKKRLVISFIVLAVMVCFFYVENNWLMVSFYAYEMNELPEAFDGYRIVQISDLHNASFGKENEKLLTKIEELAPDLVVITGDMVDSNHTDIAVAVDFARQVAAEYTVYYVAGNHENWLEESERRVLMDGLYEAGVICLEDEFVEISKGDSSITLVGLCDESLSGPTLNKVLYDSESAGASGLQILLAHEPQYIENYSKCGVDLVLTGHAHGGQFRLPFVAGGLVAPDQGFFPKYTEGVHEVDDTTMIISRGLGNSIIPVRLFNRPEIVCVELGRK